MNEREVSALLDLFPIDTRFEAAPAPLRPSDRPGFSRTVMEWNLRPNYDPAWTEASKLVDPMLLGEQNTYPRLVCTFEDRSPPPPVSSGRGSLAPLKIPSSEEMAANAEKYRETLILVDWRIDKLSPSALRLLNR